MKKLFILMLCMMILLVGTVSAFEFDNIGRYNETSRTFTIRNSVLGIPFLQLGTVAEIQLNTPNVVYVIRGNDRKVAEFTINNYGDYSNVFKKMEFYNIKKNMNKFEREFTYKYKKSLGFETINDYETICVDKIHINGTKYKDCYQELIGTRQEEIFEWAILDTSKELPTGQITIGIFTDVHARDKVEWIPTFFGVRINEWAIWTESLNVDLVSCWKCNEITGTNALDSYGTNNGTANDARVFTTEFAGIINTSADFTGGNDHLDLSLTPDYQNFTISIWIYFDTSSSVGTQRLFSFTKTGISYGAKELIARSSVIEGGLGGTPVTYGYTGTGEWVHVVLVRNVTSSSLYFNGTLRDVDNVGTGGTFGTANAFIGVAGDLSNYADIKTDEVMIWSRGLGATEVTQLWNNNNAISCEIAVPPEVTLNSPINDSNITTTRQFNATITPNLFNLTNATFYMWYSNGTVFNTTINDSLSGNQSVDVLFNISNIPLDTAMLWNVQGCQGNGAELNCSSASNNFTATARKIYEENQTYNLQAVEGTLQTLGINVSISPEYSPLLGNLIYNETTYSGSFSAIDSTVYEFTTIITTPPVDANTNVSFYWDITLTDSTKFNSTTNNQTILNLGIDNCSVYSTVIFNYTILDEEHQNKLSDTIFELDTYIFNQDKSISILNFSTSYNATNPAAICINVNLTNEAIYSLDSTVKYSSINNYTIEYYNIQNFLLRNTTVPQEINLYNLLIADSTEFQITFKDSNFVTVENALIQINRQYVSEGVFKTVEIPKTDANGQTVAHLVEKDVVYNMIVSKEGVIIGTFNNVIAFCKDINIGSCFISLNALLAQEKVYDYDSEIELFFDFDYNETTRNLQFDFSTIDGSVKNISLAALKIDQLGNTSVCNTYLISSSGTLFCPVPVSVGNETIIVDIYVEGDLKITNYIKAGTEFDIGDAGYFLMFFLVLSLALMMTQSKTGVIIGVLVGFIAAILLSFIQGGIVGIGSSTIWLAITGIILIWKLNSQGQT